MFERFRNNHEEQLRIEKEQLNNMSEKELLVELILEMKKRKEHSFQNEFKCIKWMKAKNKNNLGKMK